MCLHHSNLILIDSLTFRFPLLLLKVDCMFWAIGKAVAPGRMLGNFLPIHYTESLPLYRMPAAYGLSVLTQMEHFVCYSCEKRGFPSFFVSKRVVHTHMSKSKMCLGGESKRITVMTRPCDVIAGGSGCMGPCLPSQHQPPGICLVYIWYIPGICQ
jgi:hypothetical protein